MKKRVVITGGTGFVGANLCRRMLQLGHEVHLLVRTEHDAWRIADILTDVQIHPVSFLDVAALKKVVTTIKPEWIFHLAAYGAYSFQKQTTQILETNFIATHNLVQECLQAGFEAFVNTGSSSEYGFKKTIHHEYELPEPNSYYAVSKAASTMYCAYTAESRGVRIPTLRLYSIYGRYEDPRRLMPTLVLRALDGKYPPLVAPDTARDFVFVEDAIDAFLLAAEKTPAKCGEIYNVASSRQTSLGDLVRLVQKQFSIPSDPVWGEMENRSWDSSSWVGSNEKIFRDLGWRPKRSLTEGLENLASWFRDDSELRAFYEKLSDRTNLKK